MSMTVLRLTYRDVTQGLRRRPGEVVRQYGSTSFGGPLLPVRKTPNINVSLDEESSSSPATVRSASVSSPRCRKSQESRVESSSTARRAQAVRDADESRLLRTLICCGISSATSRRATHSGDRDIDVVIHAAALKHSGGVQPLRATRPTSSARRTSSTHRSPTRSTAIRLDRQGGADQSLRCHQAGVGQAVRGGQQPSRITTSASPSSMQRDGFRDP